MTKALVHRIALMLTLLLPLQALASGLLACEQHQESQVSLSQHETHQSVAAVPDCHGQPANNAASDEEPRSLSGLELECRHCISSCQTKLQLDGSNAGRLIAIQSAELHSAGMFATLNGFTNLPQRPPCL